MEYTSGSLKLAKPQLSDAPDITRMNPNWDKIDENISEFNDKINVLSGNGFNGVYKSDLSLSDMNNLKEVGQFEIVRNLSSISNLPYNLDGAVRMSIKNEKRFYDNDQYYYQEVSFKSNPYECEKWYRDKTDGVWTEWRQIATTSKVDVALFNNFKSVLTGENAITVTRSGNIVNIYGIIINQHTPIDGLTLGVLPIYYRPRNIYKGFINDDNGICAEIHIRKNGDIVLYSKNIDSSIEIKLNVTYII